MLQRVAPVFFSSVIAFGVVGYVVGIMDGVPQPDGDSLNAKREYQDLEAEGTNSKLIPAMSYADIPASAMGPTKSWQAAPQLLPHTQHDLFAEIEPSEEEKEISSRVRASRRAFNGAPPVISHPVENTNDAACYACHSSGVRMSGLRASVMSHQFLGNCLQCHAPMAPKPFRAINASVESSFVGLPAPKEGERAYRGAPPTIPHSQWMRENCNACHGGPHGWAGLESTHPWRVNCTQCHAPSAIFDQMPTGDDVPMLPQLGVVGE